MDHAAFRPDLDAVGGDAEELRRAPRFRLLIRAAKLITSHGEFVCVLRDVSATGVSVKLFHALPESKRVELELQCGDRFEMDCRWIRGREAGFEFTGPVDIDRLVMEIGEFPKRSIRLGIQFPLTVITLAGRCDAFAENLSQQGARIECDTLLAIDQSIRLEGGGLRENRAKVRWRSGRQYGVVFDDTLSLHDLALLAARLQCPQLLAD